MRFLQFVFRLGPVILVSIWGYLLFYPTSAPDAGFACFLLLSQLTIWYAALFTLLDRRCDKLEEQLNALRNHPTDPSASAAANVNSATQFQVGS
jgi:hypothetical protein